MCVLCTFAKGLGLGLSEPGGCLVLSVCNMSPLSIRKNFFKCCFLYKISHKHTYFPSSLFLLDHPVLYLYVILILFNCVVIFHALTMAHDLFLFAQSGFGIAFHATLLVWNHLSPLNPFFDHFCLSSLVLFCNFVCVIASFSTTFGYYECPSLCKKVHKQEAHIGVTTQD